MSEANEVTKHGSVVLGDRLQNMKLVLAAQVQNIVDSLNPRSDKELIAETDYYAQVRDSYDIWHRGGDNIVSSILDAQVQSATFYGADVDVLGNDDLRKVFQHWKDYVVNDTISTLPTGLEAVEHEWYTEYWTSSMPILYCVWEKRQIPGLGRKQWWLPTIMYVPNSHGIGVKASPMLGDKQYFFREIEEDEKPENDQGTGLFQDDEDFQKQNRFQVRPIATDEHKNLPLDPERHTFYPRTIGARISDKFPVPFLYHRNIAKLVKLKKALRRSDYRTAVGIINDILLLKKGSKELTERGIIYGAEEMQAFQNLLESRLANTGVLGTTYDTTAEHVHPDVESMMSKEKYEEVDNDILIALGLLTLTGEGEQRREVQLNPKGLILEVESARKVFKDIIEKDLYLEFRRRNARLLTGEFDRLVYYQKPMNIWLSVENKRIMRVLYDRGLIGKRDVIGSLTTLDPDVMRQHRVDEKEAGDEDTFYPPVIQNIEKDPDDLTNPNGRPDDTNVDDIQDTQDRDE